MNVEHDLSPTDHWDAAVIGGGLVGTAVAFGLSAKGMRVLVLDGGDDDLRASPSAFGLLWVQDKGDGCPTFAAWARASAAAWGVFAEMVVRATGIDVQWRPTGGLHLCLSDGEMAARDALMRRLAAAGGDFPFTMLDREGVCRRAGLKPGPRVAGASYCPLDGTVNPTALLGALRFALAERGGLCAGAEVCGIEPSGDGWRVGTTCGSVQSRRVVIAAGLDTERLAAPFGVAVPVRPVRGQILVTEAVDPVLHLPASGLMQNADGRFVIGDVHEEVGIDDSQSMRTVSRLAARAATLFPRLGALRVVGARAAVRVVPRDGVPIYGESPDHPGLFVGSCHGGLLLAPVHAGPLADWVAGDGPPPAAALLADRFGPPEAAKARPC